MPLGLPSVNGELANSAVASGCEAALYFAWPFIGGFFDQDTSSVQFRTRSMPSIVHDGSAFHAFWSARGFAGHPDDATAPPGILRRSGAGRTRSRRR